MEGNTTARSNESGYLRHPSTAARIVFATEASFSLIANLLVVFLFSCRKYLLSKPHNRCILSLSITDILTSVLIIFSPNYVLSEQFFNTAMHDFLSRELYCRVIWNNSLLFSLGATSLYISVALSLERWLAVRRSIFYRTRFKIRHMNAMIITCWIAAFLSELPLIVFIEGVYDQSTTSCRWNSSKNTMTNILLSILLFFIQTFLPAVVLTLTYVDVFRGIKESLRFAVSARAERVADVQRLKKVTKVAGITSFVLAVCWLPGGVIFFLSLLKNKPRINPNYTLVVFFSFLAFANSCINPCIYVFANPELRDALKQIPR